MTVLLALVTAGILVHAIIAQAADEPVTATMLESGLEVQFDEKDPELLPPKRGADGLRMTVVRDGIPLRPPEPDIVEGEADPD